MGVKSVLARELRGIEEFKVMRVESKRLRVLPMQYGRCRAQDLSLHALSGFTTRRLYPAARSYWLGL